MSKFLNETGLAHFWDKVKQHLTENYLNLEGGKLKNGASVETGSAEEGTTTSLQPEGMLVTKDSESMGAYGSNNVVLTRADGSQILVTPNEISLQNINNGEDIPTNIVTIQESGIKAKSFATSTGTDTEVLMADGSIKILGENSGIATLDENGKIPLSQLGNLDTTLFSIVTKLPTTDIVKNRIYLVKSETGSTDNIYTEFIYTGDVATAYDATKWEKLGEYTSEVDLSSYSKKTETINSIDSRTNNTSVVLSCNRVSGPKADVAINAATQTDAGVMTASDKKVLDTLAARYPLSIASFNVSPSLMEVGKETDATFSWAFTNSDFHPIESQKITVDNGEEQTVAVSSKSYKQTALAGLSTAGTKSATLKINDTLTRSVSITYHFPSHIGVMGANEEITAENIMKLTKSIEWGKGKTSTITQNNAVIVYAYPASYGDLTSIKDGNGFQGFAGYTKKTMSLYNQIYNVYVQKLPATSSSTYTFA